MYILSYSMSSNQSVPGIDISNEGVRPLMGTIMALNIKTSRIRLVDDSSPVKLCDMINDYDLAPGLSFIKNKVTKPVVLSYDNAMIVFEGSDIHLWYEGKYYCNKPKEAVFNIYNSHWISISICNLLHMYRGDLIYVDCLRYKKPVLRDGIEMSLLAFRRKILMEYV